MPSTAVGTKRPRPTAAAAVVEPPPVHHPNQQQQHNPTTTAAKPAAARQLSGATKNMRFMKRRSGGDPHSPQRPLDEAPPTKSNIPKKTSSITEVMRGEPSGLSTDASTALLREGDVQQSVHEKMHHSGESSDEEMVDADNHASSCAALPLVPVQTATPQDMYGWEQSVALGRRSFGGFQPVTAENWYHQQQAHKATLGQQLSKRELRRLQSSTSRQGRKQPPHDQQPNKRNNNKRLKQISGAGGRNLKSAVARREKLMDELMME